ncbi:ATP-dependent DNA helicase PIF1, partial [Brachionus plicatilis]
KPESEELHKKLLELISDGEKAEERVISYTDTLISAINPRTDFSDNCVPDPHPCSLRTNKIKLEELPKDYENLIYCCQRHKCRLDGYFKSSLAKNYGKCRFSFPFELESKTRIEFKETAKSVRAEIVFARNDPYLNMHNRLICHHWRGNVDMQVILDKSAAINYMVKYATKGEKAGQSLCINPKQELIIATNQNKDLEFLKNPLNWPKDAFDVGIELINKNAKFFIALHKVDPDFNIEDEETKQYLKVNYNIDNVMRVKKKGENGLPTDTVKAIVLDRASYEKLIDEKKLRIGYTYIRVSAWRFGTKPTQCFNCNQLTHRTEDCKNDKSCLRCGSKEHTHKSCPISKPNEYFCTNCNEHGHTAVSKICTKLNEAKKQKEEREGKKINQALNQNNFYRQESVSPQYQNQNGQRYIQQQQQQEQQQQLQVNNQLMSFYDFMIKKMLQNQIEFMLNFSKITSTIYDGGQPFIDHINNIFGPQYASYVQNELSTRIITQEQMNLDENHNE